MSDSTTHHALSRVLAKAKAEPETTPNSQLRRSSLSPTVTGPPSQKEKPVNVVDTVGAGDSFDAGFLYGYLNKWSLEKSLQLGCICGGLSTQRAGGTDGQPTLEDARAFFQ